MNELPSFFFCGTFIRRKNTCHALLVPLHTRLYCFSCCIRHGKCIFKTKQKPKKKTAEIENIVQHSSLQVSPRVIQVSHVWYFDRVCSGVCRFLEWSTKPFPLFPLFVVVVVVVVVIFSRCNGFVTALNFVTAAATDRFPVSLRVHF